jgi:hypothetical protein
MLILIVVKYKNERIDKMLKINSKNFNFQFFLSDSIKVKSLKAGALQHGGATKANNKIYSNIAGSDYITINSDNNKLSIFIPDTMQVNKKADNSEFINYSINYIQQNFNNVNNIQYEKTKGSWYSEDLQKVVYDNITIISFESDSITAIDINIMTILASYIKNHMSQEGVTITINNSMAII